jgi:hypothetical protein
MLAISVRVVLTAVCLASAAICVRRCAGPGSRRSRINDGVHVLMSAEMIAMAWSIPDPYGVGIAVFTAAALWFAVQATGVPLSRAGLVAGTVPAGPICPGHGHEAPARTQCLHHAFLLATMVWMMLPSRTGDSMPGMTAASTSAVIGGYLLIVATGWIVNVLVRAQRDARTAISYAAMTATMGVMLLTMV